VTAAFEWESDGGPGPRPTLDPAALLAGLREDGDAVVFDEQGREWERLVHGRDGVLAARRRDGAVFLWGTPQEWEEALHGADSWARERASEASPDASHVVAQRDRLETALRGLLALRGAKDAGEKVDKALIDAAWADAEAALP
jgi:hypothetical protein